jgi:hypothetical protein
MILIFTALIFNSIGYSASPAVQCPPLMIKAGVMADGDFTTHSATEQYLSYLQHFVGQGELGLDELKYLKGFSEVPNLIDLFGAKIHEGYVYHENIEALRSHVNHERYLAWLDKQIAEKIQEVQSKQVAHGQTESVWAYGPFVKPGLLNDKIFAGNELNFTKRGSEAFVFNSVEKTITDLSTEQSISLMGLNENGVAEHVWHEIDNKPYLVVKTISGFSPVYYVYDPHQVKPILGASAARSDGEPHLVKNKNGQLALAVFDHNSMLIESNPRTYDSTIKLPPRRHTPQWHTTSDGHSLFLYTSENDKAVKKLTVLDITAGGTKVFEIPWGAARTPASLTKINENHYVIASSDLNVFFQFWKITKAKDSEWEINWDDSLATSHTAITSVVLRDGKIAHLANAAEFPLTIIKGETTKAFDDIGEVTNVFNLATGEQVAIAKGISKPGIVSDRLFIIDLNTLQVRSFDPPERKHLIHFAGCQLNAQGQLIAYFGPLISWHIKGPIVPVLLYGPIKPGEYK